MLEILLVLFSVFACFFFAGIEMALISVRKVRLRYLSRKNSEAKYILNLLENPNRMLILILIGNNLAIVLGSLMAENLMGRWYGNGGKVMAFFGMSFIFISVAEILPKSLFRMSPAFYAVSLAPLVRISFFFLTPFQKLIEWGTKFISRNREDFFKESLSLSRREFLMMIEEKAKMGIIRKHESDLIFSISSLRFKTVETIMIPWKEVACLKEGEPFSALKEIFRKKMVSHVPFVSGKDSKSEVLGMVSIKEILFDNRFREFFKGFLQEESLKWDPVEILKPVVKVKRNDSLSEVYSRLVQKNTEAAIIFEENIPLGMVTLGSFIQIL